MIRRGGEHSARLSGSLTACCLCSSLHDTSTVDEKQRKRIFDAYFHSWFSCIDEGFGNLTRWQNKKSINIWSVFLYLQLDSFTHSSFFSFQQVKKLWKVINKNWQTRLLVLVQLSVVHFDVSEETFRFFYSSLGFHFAHESSTLINQIGLNSVWFSMMMKDK